MSGLFKSILIPIDFGANTEVAVKQAVELACLHGSLFIDDYWNDDQR